MNPTPLISTPSEVAAFRLEAYSWMGTKFRPRACVKGAAVDCVNYPRAVLRTCGASLAGDYPAYEVDRSKHSDQSLILEWFAQHPQEIRRVELGTIQTYSPAGLQPGDAIVFKLNRCADHLGLLVNPDGGLFINAVWPQGVTHGHLTDSTWWDQLHSIWRVYRL